MPFDVVTLDPVVMTRLRHLIRLESMVHVGCRFLPDDLTPREWDELITLAQERQWVDEQIRKQQDRQHHAEHSVESSLDAGRKELGIPPVGGSLFPREKPMR